MEITVGRRKRFAVAAARLTATLVLATVLCVALTTPASAAIKIVKIRYNPPGADDGSNESLNGEWITIRNTGEKERSLLGWRIRDSDGNVKRLSIALPAETTVKLHTGAGADSFPHHLYWFSEDYVWDNNADRATLRNRRGRVIDRCSHNAPSRSVKVC